MAWTLKRKVMVVFAASLFVIFAVAAHVGYLVHYGRSVPPPRPNTIKIACVGDSITYGIHFSSEGYPQQLGLLLGSAYSVGNFGAIGHTVQRQGNQPYWEHRYFGLSSAYAPDLVVIMLGTNDSKAKNWAGPARFSDDYRALIEHYQSLPSRPHIVLMTPPGTFLVRGRTALPAGINGERVAEISSIIKSIGASLSIPVVDIHNATASHPEFFQMDGVHPNLDGDKFIARALYDQLRINLKE